MIHHYTSNAWVVVMNVYVILLVLVQFYFVGGWYPPCRHTHLNLKQPRHKNQQVRTCFSQGLKMYVNELKLVQNWDIVRMHFDNVAKDTARKIRKLYFVNTYLCKTIAQYSNEHYFQNISYYNWIEIRNNIMFIIFERVLFLLIPKINPSQSICDQKRTETD